MRSTQADPLACGYGDSGGAVTNLRDLGEAFATKSSRTFGAAALGYPTPRELGFGEVLGADARLPPAVSGMLLLGRSRLEDAD